jgi:excisionase family DNA binding protein
MPAYPTSRSLTARQVADRFGVGEQTVRRWTRAGRLVSVDTRFGRRYRLADLERLELDLAREP